jgi:hypothetical protein
MLSSTSCSTFFWVMECTNIKSLILNIGPVYKDCSNEIRSVIILKEKRLLETILMGRKAGTLLTQHKELPQ